MKYAAIFDMDGLLFDTERLCWKGWQVISPAFGYSISSDIFFSCVGRNRDDTKKILTQACGEDFPYEEFTGQVRAWMNAYMIQNGVPEKPGVRILFDFLKGCAIPMALATSSGEKTARWMVERAGLLPFFDAFAFGSEVEHGKPFPDIFLLAAKRLGDIPPASCIVFEDSPSGIRAASKAGMKPVFIKDFVKPDPAVSSIIWKELQTLDQAATSLFFSDM